MSKFNLSSYSETDSYDSECGNLHRIHYPSITSFLDTKNIPRYEFKIEIAELLAKFAEYSNLGTKFSCKYINHPITSGLLLYIPYHRITKYSDGSLKMGSESDWDTYDSTNENRYGSKSIKTRVKKVLPSRAIYLQRGKSKNDVSYARMVKKPRIQSLSRFNYKEESWGKRYPNKRYVMNNSIQNSFQKILLVISDKCAKQFSEKNFSIAMKGICTKIQFNLQCFSQNLRRNQYKSFRQVLNEFGKLFHSSRLISTVFLIFKIFHPIKFERKQ